MPTAKSKGTVNTAPLSKLRAVLPELDRREADRRQPKTLWARFKRWLNARWVNWKRWLKAAMDAAAMSMGAYGFFRAFGVRTFLTMLVLGLFLAPIENNNA